ncbi:hypothetical protein [Nakamurella lactea]|nr:hypothetical protein [Nakamurella lactea]
MVMDGPEFVNTAIVRHHLRMSDRQRANGGTDRGALARNERKAYR